MPIWCVECANVCISLRSVSNEINCIIIIIIIIITIVTDIFKLTTIGQLVIRCHCSPVS